MLLFILDWFFLDIDYEFKFFELCGCRVFEGYMELFLLDNLCFLRVVNIVIIEWFNGVVFGVMGCCLLGYIWVGIWVGFDKWLILVFYCVVFYCVLVVF